MACAGYYFKSYCDIYKRYGIFFFLFSMVNWTVQPHKRILGRNFSDLQKTTNNKKLGNAVTGKRKIKTNINCKWR